MNIAVYRFFDGKMFDTWQLYAISLSNYSHKTLSNTHSQQKANLMFEGMVDMAENRPVCLHSDPQFKTQCNQNLKVGWSEANTT